MTLKALAVRVKLFVVGVLDSGDDELRLLDNSKHVLAQNGAHGAVAGLISPAAEAGVHIGLAVFGDNAWVELEFISCAVAKAGAVLIVNIA